MGKVINKVRERQHAIARKRLAEDQARADIKLLTSIATMYRPGRFLVFEASVVIASLAGAIGFLVYLWAKG